MKRIKSLLSIITIAFAMLGLFKILPFYITNPIMLTALATFLLLSGVEYKKSRDQNGFLIPTLAAFFIYIVVIYNVFIG